MPYDRGAMERVSQALSASTEGVVGRPMMGAYCFMVDGRMCCGVTGDALMLRLGPEGALAALKEPHVRPFEIGGGRQPEAYVQVDPPGYATDAALRTWLARSLEFLRLMGD